MPARKQLPDFFGRATEIYGEHANLRDTTAELQALCNAGAAPELARVLPEYRRALVAHFHAEESAGYFGILETEQPELASSIAKLRAEHQWMLSELDQLARLAANQEADELIIRTRSLLARFRAHEHTENELLQDFFGR